MISLYLLVNADSLRKLFKSSRMTGVSIFKTSTAKLTLGVGTLIAFPVNLSLSSGIALDTALTAPVDVDHV